MDNDKIDLKNPFLAAVLAWFVPGLGHAYQGRMSKALLFFVCVLGLYGFGVYKGTWKVAYFRWDDKEWSWAYLAQAGAGGIAIPALFQEAGVRPTNDFGNETTPNEFEIAYDEIHRTRGKEMDLARIVTMIAGLLNILCICDAFAGPALWDEEKRLRAEAASAKNNSALEATT